MGERTRADEPSPEFRILGPLEAVAGARPLDLGSPKQRDPPAILLINAGRVVSTAQLADDLWSGEPPDRPEPTLQAYVSRLRKVLGAERLVTRAPGYMLDVRPDDVDAMRFERLLTSGRDARNDGEPDARVAPARGAGALARTCPRRRTVPRRGAGSGSARGVAHGVRRGAHRQRSRPRRGGRARRRAPGAERDGPAARTDRRTARDGAVPCRTSERRTGRPPARRARAPRTARRRSEPGAARARRVDPAAGAVLEHRPTVYVRTEVGAEPRGFIGRERRAHGGRRAAAQEPGSSR